MEKSERLTIACRCCRNILEFGWKFCALCGTNVPHDVYELITKDEHSRPRTTPAPSVNGWRPESCFDCSRLGGPCPAHERTAPAPSVAEERVEPRTADATRVDELLYAVKRSGLRLGPSLHDEPSLWCLECGRDGAFHYDYCSKSGLRRPEARPDWHNRYRVLANALCEGCLQVASDLVKTESRRERDQPCSDSSTGSSSASGGSPPPPAPSATSAAPRATPDARTSDAASIVDSSANAPAARTDPHAITCEFCDVLHRAIHCALKDVPKTECDECGQALPGAGPNASEARRQAHEEWCVICRREPRDHSPEQYAACMRACGMVPAACAECGGSGNPANWGHKDTCSARLQALKDERDIAALCISQHEEP